MPEKTVLIQPLPVERDIDGWFSHPDYLLEFDDEIKEAQLPAGVQAIMVDPASG